MRSPEGLSRSSPQVSRTVATADRSAGACWCERVERHTLRAVAATRKALIRGGLVGCAVGVPMGVVAGLFFEHMLGEDLGFRGVWFVVMVTVAFVGWAGFLGAMLKLQADEPN